MDCQCLSGPLNISQGVRVARRDAWIANSSAYDDTTRLDPPATDVVLTGPDKRDLDSLHDLPPALHHP